MIIAAHILKWRIYRQGIKKKLQTAKFQVFFHFCFCFWYWFALFFQNAVKVNEIGHLHAKSSHLTFVSIKQAENVVTFDRFLSHVGLFMKKKSAEKLILFQKVVCLWIGFLFHGLIL